MRILFVMNNAFTTGNGLATSCRRTIRYLREAGEDVRLLSASNPTGDQQPDYRLPDDSIPVFSGIIRKQGYAFAKLDDRTIREAVRWADVVHLEEPFDLEIRVCRIAKEENVPLTATYHLHPENFFSSVHLQRSLWFNRMTMLVWRNRVFNHCRIVQCPTENVRQRLERWRFKAELRVISNGVPPRSGTCMSGLKREQGIYNVITIGRYSVEKDQMTLLKAMRYSRYSDRIRLVFAGKGPLEQKLKSEAKRLFEKAILKIPPVFGFYTSDELPSMCAQADLYVHCANVEVEGMSCMEAIRTGLVPVIAEGKLTATPQFALSAFSLYPAGNARALAERIDYWLSHDEERRQEARRYRSIDSEYAIEKSIEQLRKMFHDATR